MEANRLARWKAWSAPKGHEAAEGFEMKGQRTALPGSPDLLEYRTLEVLYTLLIVEPVLLFGLTFLN